MTNAAATFTAPTPPMTTLTGLVTKLTACQTAADTHAHGAAAARDAQWLLVESGFAQELSYVQILADNSAGTDEAIAMLQLAGMTYEKEHVQPKRTFKGGEEFSTVVDLTAPAAGDNTAVIWEYGPTATTMNSWIVTIHGLLTLENQTPGTTLCIRYRIVTVNGYGEWSQILTHLVT